ncbi:hypothetical protein RQP46_010853 [Phenoliferia psychrophenolica]
MLMPRPSVTAFFSLKAATPTGSYDFKQLAGKVTLIVNVASRCGYTSQYSGLQALYGKYQAQGLVVLGFPCNQFGGQESGSANEIQNFCEKNYGVTFPILAKSDVNGKNTNSVYAYLKEQKPSDIGWNFEKFVVGKDGQVYKRYDSSDRPESIAADIESLLAKA